MDAPNEALLASQLCGMLAPCLAFIAICISTIELLCCRFSGSFVLESVLLLAASLFQSGTFGIFLIDQDLCFDSDGCTIGKAAYISTSAIFFYFSACILLCCSPRPFPCMQNTHKKRCESAIDDEIEAPEQWPHELRFLVQFAKVSGTRNLNFFHWALYRYNRMFQNKRLILTDIAKKVLFFYIIFQLKCNISTCTYYGSNRI